MLPTPTLNMSYHNIQFDCSISLISDDVLASRIFAILPIWEKFQVEAVCRRWARLMDTQVWPQHKIITSLDLASRNPSRTLAKYHTIRRRCRYSIVHLDLDLISTALESKDNLYAFPNLRHLRLEALLLRREIITSLATELPQLKSLALEKAINMSIDLTDCLTGLNNLEAMWLTVVDNQPLPMLSGLPPSLNYLGISSSRGIDGWIEVAARYCPANLYTLRIMPTEGESGATPSAKSLELLGNFHRLQVLQVALDESDESSEAIKMVFAQLSLRSLSITLPSLNVLHSILHSLSSKLEHLSMIGGARRLFWEHYKEFDSMAKLRDMPLYALRTLKLKHFGGVKSLSFELIYPKLERIESADYPDVICIGGLSYLIRKHRLPIRYMASTLEDSEILYLNKFLKERHDEELSSSSTPITSVCYAHLGKHVLSLPQMDYVHVVSALPDNSGDIFGSDLYHKLPSVFLDVQRW